MATERKLGSEQEARPRAGAAAAALASQGALCALALALSLALVSSAACRVKPSPVRSSHTTRGPIEFVSNGAPNKDEIAVRVAIIADNQFHNLYGKPYYLENRVADSLVGSAVRPGTTNAVGPYAFRYFVENQKFLISAHVVLHLGDAADISCPTEFERFLNIMKASGRPWVFAPGNHDGYFVGNSYHARDNKKNWEPACANGTRATGSRLGKDDMIKEYVKARFGETTFIKETNRDNINLEGFEGAHGSKEIGTPKRKVTVEYWARINKDKPWRSYILQRVTIKARYPVSIILLDTATYKRAPKFRKAGPIPGKVAGKTGELTTPQKREAEIAIAAVVSDGQRLVLAGHDNLKPNSARSGLVRQDSRWVLEQLAKKGQIYLSAHTHAGGFTQFRDAVDLNVTSLVDWPLGFRKLHVVKNKYFTEEVFFRDPASFDGLDVNCTKHEKGGKAGTDEGAMRTQGRSKALNLLAALRGWAKLPPSKRLTELHELGLVNAIAALEDLAHHANPSANSQLRSTTSNANTADLIEKLRTIHTTVDTSIKENKGAKRTEILAYAWCQLYWSAKADGHAVGTSVIEKKGD